MHGGTQIKNTVFAIYCCVDQLPNSVLILGILYSHEASLMPELSAGVDDRFGIVEGILTETTNRSLETSARHFYSVYYLSSIRSQYMNLA